MSGTEDYSIYDDGLMKALADLKSKDVEAFTNLILKVLRSNPEEAIEDRAPAKKKLNALNSMQEYLITTERYEDCTFVKDLIEKITDGQE